METERPCGCKGCRTCLLCEQDLNLTQAVELNRENGTYVYCAECRKAYPGWDLDLVLKQHPNHDGDPIDFPGIYIDADFLSDVEEKYLIRNMDGMQWDLSQSGRRKQNFGPKCNFKKRKLRIDGFDGFPRFSKFVQEKFREQAILADFQTIEQCSLEYNPDRGASIDPHIDDCWIWGERIVTVNLLSDSVLTMTYNDKPQRYNLDCVADYPRILDDNGHRSTSGDFYRVKPIQPNDAYPIVRVPMPRKSLLVMYGAARYDWEHRILREDIVERRVCLAYREFTPPYLEQGALEEEGKPILQRAQEFGDYFEA